MGECEANKLLETECVCPPKSVYGSLHPPCEDVWSFGGTSVEIRL